MSLVLSLAPIISRLNARFAGNIDISGFANDRIELAPSCVRYSPRIISLPGESLRATGTMAHTNMEVMRALEPEGEHVHGATIAYRLDNALIADGCYYCGLHYGVGRPNERRRPLILDHAEDFGEAQLSTDMSSDIYFGHWLCDGLCTELLAIRRGMPGVTYKRPIGQHEAGYRNLLQIAGNAVTLAKIEKFWVVDDRGINRDREGRFLELRARLEANITPSLGSPCVFILRGTSGVARKLINEKEIADALAKKGFDIVDPMILSAEETAQRLSVATLVVSVEGSHSSHALLAMPSGGAIIIIQPPERFLHSWKFFADIAGLRYGFVVADPHPEGFTLDPDRLFSVVDLVATVVKSPKSVG